MMQSAKRAIVLLSGGMDSCVCAALAARDHTAAALHVSYGQRTENRERQSFLAICQRLNIPDKLLVRNEALRDIGGSALTDENISVPTADAAGHVPGRRCRAGVLEDRRASISAKPGRPCCPTGRSGLLADLPYRPRPSTRRSARCRTASS